MKTESRTLRTLSTVTLDNAVGSDTYGQSNLWHTGTDFPGWNNLSSMYDQYQVKACRVSIFPVSSDVTDPTTNIVDLNATKIFSCLDFDTDANLDLDNILSRKGFRFQDLSAQKQLVKQYVPRFIRRSPVISEQAVTLDPRIQWFNTSTGTQSFGGLKLFIKNYGGLNTHPGTTELQNIKLMIEWDIDLRGQKFT
jgi:hypothetical protein